MNVIKENIDKLNARLKVQISKEDYSEKVDKALRDYRKKASFDGFRPGKVPLGLVSKLYRKPILVDEINKLVSDETGKYIETEKLQVLGEPMPSEEMNKNIDWDHQEEFEFIFDIGLAPEFEVELNQKLKVPFYTINIDAEMIDKSVDDITRRNGKFIEADSIGSEDMLKGDIKAVDSEGTPIPDGAAAEDVIISLPSAKDDAERDKFIGKLTGDTIVFDLKPAFPLDTDRIGLLRLDKKDGHKAEGLFSFFVKEIKRYEKAAINQELFDKVYGPEVVKSEAEFRDKISADLSKSLETESDYRFSIDAKEVLLDKVKIELPADFLKRWMLYANEGKITQDQIDHEFHHFEEDLRWQLIIGKIAKFNNITLEEDELKAFTGELARKQFERYGMYNVAEENLNNYVTEVLNKPEERRRLAERKLEEKIITFVKQTVKLDDKSISADDFNKLFEKEKEH
jgi:trigger factor